MMLRDSEGLCVCIVRVCVNSQRTLVLFGGIEKTVVHLLWHKEPNITHRIQKECVSVAVCVQHAFCSSVHL